MNANETFSCGTLVYVDGVSAAVVRDYFPEGSSSFGFPHYKLRMKGAHKNSPDANVCVAIGRVQISKKRAPKKTAVERPTLIGEDHGAGRW